MAVEVLIFGQLFTFFRYLHRTEKQSLSRVYGLFPPVMESWLFTLNFIRNTCAHHARLWNREIPIRPIIPDQRHNPEWHIPTIPDNTRVYTVLTLIQYLMKHIDQHSNWQAKLDQLLDKYIEIQVHFMGFPTGWQDCPIWN